MEKTDRLEEIREKRLSSMAQGLLGILSKEINAAMNDSIK